MKFGIRNRLLNLVDEDYKKFNEKLCPDTNKKILGIRIPEIRALAKEILKDTIGWEEYVKDNSVEYFEEVLIQGLLIGYSKLLIEEKIELLKYVIPRLDSWAMTDTIVPTLKIKNSNLVMYWDFIMKYINSDKEFEVRFAIISMLDYYITDEYVDKVIKILNTIKHEGYYVKMGIAWTLAEVGIKYNNELLSFIISNDNKLDKFTHNKTLQKMIESYRIDDKQKELLRSLKRK